MRRLIWALAWTGVALWSLFALGAYGLLDLFWSATTAGTDLTRPAPGSFTTGEPHPLEALFPFLGALKALGGFALAAVWLVGALTLLGGTWALLRINDALWAATGPQRRNPPSSAGEGGRRRPPGEGPSALTRIGPSPDPASRGHPLPRRGEGF
jgi:hypothetical protein